MSALRISGPLLLVLAAVVVAPPAHAGCGTGAVVNIPDANLLAELRVVLVKPAGDILDTDLCALSTLDLRNSNIADLTGLEHCVALSTLVISNNQVASLAPLATLAGLKTLLVYSNAISDLSPIAALTGLTSLGVSDNALTSLEGIAGLTALKTLSASENGLTDLSAIAGATALQSVELQDNLITDLSGLSALPMLKELDLSGNPLPGVTALSALTALEELRLNECGLLDLAGIETLTALTLLEFSDNAISSLAPIAPLTALETLTFRDNSVLELGPVAGLLQLRSLFASSNPIVNVAPLAGLPTLRTLYLDEINATDFSPLASVPLLRWLNLDKSPIEDPSFLAGLDEIAILSLDQTGLSEVSPLQALPKLNNLSLRDNAVADLAPLVDNAALQTGASINVLRNPLGPAALCVQIPALDARGVDVDFTGACIPASANDTCETAKAIFDGDSASGSTVGATGASTSACGDGDSADVWFRFEASKDGVLYLSSCGTDFEHTVSVYASCGGATLGCLTSPCIGALEVEVDLGESYYIRIAGNEGATGNYALQVAALGCADDDTPATFADPGLETVVRKHLNKPSGTILRSELCGITELSDGANGGPFVVKDLSGIEQCVNLKKLDFSRAYTGAGNDISDLSPLAGLTQLTYIDLSNNQIADLTPLAALSNLDYLSLITNEISSLTPLSGLSKLTELRLADNNITDTAPLSGLLELTSLYLGFNPSPSLAGIAGLPKLAVLNLWSAGISDITVVSTLPVLTVLNLSYNPCEDLSPIATLAPLMLELELRGITGADLSPLAAFTGFYLLDLGEMGLEDGDLAVLQDMPYLTNAWLDGNNITSLGAFSGNPDFGPAVPFGPYSDLEDVLIVTDNPLSAAALCIQIPAIEGRGGVVHADQVCAGGPDNSCATPFEAMLDTVYPASCTFVPESPAPSCDALAEFGVCSALHPRMLAYTASAPAQMAGNTSTP